MFNHSPLNRKHHQRFPQNMILYQKKPTKELKGRGEDEDEDEDSTFFCRYIIGVNFVIGHQTMVLCYFEI